MSLPSGVEGAYTYDDASQLTELTYSSGQTTLGNVIYAYDLAGRRTETGGTWARTGLPQPVTAATYNAANRLSLWAGNTYAYDLNGNLASDGLTSYTWDARNQLVGLSGATLATFQYDGLRRRRLKTVGGTTTNFLFDGINLVQELSGSTPTANLLAGGGIDETFTRADSSGTSTLLIDALGSALALADASGAVRTQYTFDPFGATTASGATNSNALLFTGRENDGTGLYYYRARYHNPSLGRFTSEDPIGFHGGINLYAYAADSPTNLVDPSGTQALPLPIPPPGPAPLVIPPWVSLILFDVALLEHDWHEFQKLCMASVWSWCSPRPENECSNGRQAKCTRTSGYNRWLGGCTYFCEDGKVWVDESCDEFVYKDWGR